MIHSYNHAFLLPCYAGGESTWRSSSVVYVFLGFSLYV